ncbi:LacI family DNA-binding transcriptional regulator [Bacteroidota bacterium]
MSITIKDIARMLNVSHTTVSRALNDSPLISKETKARVKETARKYNYVPNVNARRLVTSKSYNIGLFFTTINKGTTANFFMDTIKGVNSIIEDKYSLSVEGIDNFHGFSKITKRQFDGIILMSQSSKDDHFIKHVIDQEIPLILLNRETEIPNIITVLSDDKVGAYKATEYLIQNGHREIGLIEGKAEFRTTQRREEGFLMALTDYGLESNPDWIVNGNYDLEGGYNAMRKLLVQQDLPTAIFSSNDDMAVGAMKAISELKLIIPDDISIIGFDDSMYAAYLSPALTTIKRPITDISAVGADLLLEKMTDIENDQPLLNYIKTELILRESVKKIF